MKNNAHETTAGYAEASTDHPSVIIDLTDGDEDDTFEFEVEIEIDITPTSTSVTADGTLIRRYDLNGLTISADPDVNDNQEIETLINARIVGLEDAA